jgi:hypothetical protein
MPTEVMNNFHVDRIHRRKFSFLSTHGRPRPHCFWSKSLLTTRHPIAPHRRLPTTHHRPPTLTAARPRQAPPPPGLPHRHPVVPGPVVAWLPPRVPGRLSLGPIVARHPPLGPCSVDATSSSTAPPARPERTLSWQPIASARPGGGHHGNGCPTTPRSSTSIAGPIFSLFTG